jgi:hypothetical protein
VADKRCDNGHFIDESWDLCPYCPAESGDHDIPVVRPARAVAPLPPPTLDPSRAVTAIPAPVATPPSPRRDPITAPVTAPVAAQVAQTPPMDRTITVQKIDPNLPAKRYVVAWLVGINGVTRGESFQVRMGRNVLGRDRKCDIVINDDQASAHHADLVFRPEERRFILMDHNSTNGTYVNEAEIEPRRDLVGREVIRIGSHKFLFVPLIDEGFYWDHEGALK